MANMSERMRLHLHSMIARAARYVEPTAYISLNGAQFPEPGQRHTAREGSDMRAQRAKAFANDMVYLLDVGQRVAMVPDADPRPIAWSYEAATMLNSDREPIGWGEPRLSFQEPSRGYGYRNVTPLYAAPCSECVSWKATAAAEAERGNELAKQAGDRVAAMPTLEVLTDVILESARSHGNDSPVDYGDAEGIARDVLKALGTGQ